MNDFVGLAALVSGGASGIGAPAERFGGLDVLVDNAGIGAVGDVGKNDDAKWARVLDVSVTGIARVTRDGAAAPAPLRACGHRQLVLGGGVRRRAAASPVQREQGRRLGAGLAMAAHHVGKAIRVNAAVPEPRILRGSAGCSTPRTTRTRSRRPSPPPPPRRPPAPSCGSTPA
jgi:NAD(P)-dependent dehydrogenase (short-subunit alcohol dehydrogenase family)